MVRLSHEVMMATTTFENLKPEKREQFLAAAFAEFARNDFHSASVSRIVATLGIAKGSVYQYFEDKTDLYRYLLDLASTRKLASIEARTAELPPEADFFAVHKAIILAGAAFDFGYPEYSLLIVNAMREPPCPELGDLAAGLARRSAEFLQTFVTRGVRSGDIRDDLDHTVIQNAVNALTLAVGPHMEQKYRFSLRVQLEHPDRSLPFTDKDLERETDALIDVLRRGIGR